MQRQTETGLTIGEFNLVMAQKHKLVGALPCEDEVWTWGETEIPKDALWALDQTELLVRVDDGPPIRRRASARLCATLRHYDGDDACVSLAEDVSTENQ